MMPRIQKTCSQQPNASPTSGQKFTIQTTSEHPTQHEHTWISPVIVNLSLSRYGKLFCYNKNRMEKGLKENWTGAETRCQIFKTLE